MKVAMMQKNNSRLARIAAIIISLAAIAAAVWAIIQALQPEPAGEQAASGTIVIGAEAPDFEAANTEGQKVRLSDYRGQMVLINFWASWCKPCVREMPLINEVYQGSGDGTAVLFVNVGDSKGTITEYMETQKYSFPVIIDVTGRISGHYGITGLPATIIVDKDGTIRQAVMGEITDPVMLTSWLKAKL
jgi:peroxiredoxin